MNNDDDDEIHTKEDFIKKLKKMSEEDLWHYRNAGKTVERICAILGIGMCFLIMNAPGVLMTCLISAGVFLLAKVSVSAAETVTMVEQNLERFKR